MDFCFVDVFAYSKPVDSKEFCYISTYVYSKPVDLKLLRCGKSERCNI